MEIRESIVSLVNNTVWGLMVTPMLRSLDIKESVKSSIHSTLVRSVNDSISNIYLSVSWE